MNWEAIGAIGEILGAIGVIGSLFYVAFQVKQSSKQTSQNTIAIENAAWESTVRIINDVRLQIASNDEIIRLWNKGLSSPTGLSETELTRFRIFMASLMSTFTMQYEQYTKLQMDSDYWEPTLEAIKRFANSAGFEWYWDNFSQESSNKFQIVVNDILEAKRAKET